MIQKISIYLIEKTPQNIEPKTNKMEQIFIWK